MRGRCQLPFDLSNPAEALLAQQGVELHPRFPHSFLGSSAFGEVTRGWVRPDTEVPASPGVTVGTLGSSSPLQRPKRAGPQPASERLPGLRPSLALGTLLQTPCPWRKGTVSKNARQFLGKMKIRIVAFPAKAVRNWIGTPQFPPPPPPRGAICTEGFTPFWKDIKRRRSGEEAGVARSPPLGLLS